MHRSQDASLYHSFQFHKGGGTGLPESWKRGFKKPHYKMKSHPSIFQPPPPPQEKKERKKIPGFQWRIWGPTRDTLQVATSTNGLWRSEKKEEFQARYLRARPPSRSTSRQMLASHPDALGPWASGPMDGEPSPQIQGQPLCLGRQLALLRPFWLREVATKVQHPLEWNH